MRSLWVYVCSRVCQDMCAVQVYAGGSPSWRRLLPQLLSSEEHRRALSAHPRGPLEGCPSQPACSGDPVSVFWVRALQAGATLSTYVGSGHTNSAPHTGAQVPYLLACFPKRLLDKWCWIQWSKGNSKGCSYANKHNYLRSLERKWKQKERPIWSLN